MKGWRFWLGLVIGIAALVYFSFDLEVAAIAQTWRKIDPVWFLLGIFFFCFSFWLRCPRWKILAHDLGEVTLNLMTKAFFVGMLVNRIFPARLGELARCVVLKRKAGISLIGLLATVAAEKAFDALALLTVTLLAISALPTEGLPPAERPKRVRKPKKAKRKARRVATANTEPAPAQAPAENHRC